MKIGRQWRGRRCAWLALGLALGLRPPVAPTQGVVTAGAGASRIKDIARIAGLDSLDLVGYGIVVGLRGTGDKDLQLTRQTAANLMENFKISIRAADISSMNVAAVIVTATAPPFHKAGDRIDVQISSIGDATSLEGGILIMTPMFDPNGDLTALAQGSVTLGGYSAGRDTPGGASVARNHTTSGAIPSAAVLRVSQTGNFFRNGLIQLVLRHPDFTTADRMATAINREMGGLAVARDASTITVKIPDQTLDIGQAAAFVARLETIRIQPDMQARVIVNERTGTIVMGGEVHIGQAVVAHGNITVTIKETLHPSHPSNMAIGLRDAALDVRSLETPDTEVTVDEEKARVMVVPTTTTVRDLADTLNIMGATPRDLISILQALHRLGAIQMELTAM
jgi:flagellar P-ring protein FlgI